MALVVLKQDLDVLVVEITAANVSYVNEVERTMPAANLALQHTSFARAKMSDKDENAFKSANSGKAIREIIQKAPDEAGKIRMRDVWRSSVKPVRDMLEKRFSSTKPMIHLQPLYNQPLTKTLKMYGIELQTFFMIILDLI